nr:hypothetical protein [uncultured bacterium]
MRVQAHRSVAPMRSEKAEQPRWVNYDKAMQDGKFKLLLHTDNDASSGATPAHYADLLTRNGFNELPKGRDGSRTFRRDAGPGENVLEVKISKPPTNNHQRHDQEFFGGILEDDVDGVIYSGHYSEERMRKMVSRCSEDRASNRELAKTDKLVAFLACNGDAGATLLDGIMPRAVLVTTTQISDEAVDDPLLESLALGLAKSEGWDKIHARYVTNARVSVAKAGEPGYDVASHYWSSSEDGRKNTIMARRRDRDGDGVVDVLDRSPGPRVAVPPLPRKTHHVSSYTGVDDNVVDQASAERLRYSANFLTARFRGFSLPDSYFKQGPVLNGAEFLANGFFKPTKKDLAAVPERAFRFELMSGTEPPRFKVQLSERFAHASDLALRRELAWEFGTWAAKELIGLDDDDTQAFAAISLSQALDGYKDVGRRRLDPTQTPREHEKHFREKHGLGMSFAKLKELTWQSDYVTLAMLKDVKRALRDED